MATPSHSQRGQIKPYGFSRYPFFTNRIQIRNRSPFLIRLAALDSFPPGEAIAPLATGDREGRPYAKRGAAEGFGQREYFPWYLPDCFRGLG